jgi:hypothetical protein
MFTPGSKIARAPMKTRLPTAIRPKRPEVGCSLRGPDHQIRRDMVWRTARLAPIPLGRPVQHATFTEKQRVTAKLLDISGPLLRFRALETTYVTMAPNDGF